MDFLQSIDFIFRDCIHATAAAASTVSGHAARPPRSRQLKGSRVSSRVPVSCVVIVFFSLRRVSSKLLAASIDLNVILPKCRISMADSPTLRDDPMPITSVEIREIYRDETEEWGKVLRAAQIKVE